MRSATITSRAATSLRSKFDIDDIHVLFTQVNGIYIKKGTHNIALNIIHYNNNHVAVATLWEYRNVDIVSKWKYLLLQKAHRANHPYTHIQSRANNNKNNKKRAAKKKKKLIQAAALWFVQRSTALNFAVQLV